jgi:hypothetical protein
MNENKWKTVMDEEGRKTPSTAAAVPLPREGGTGKKRTALYPPCEIGDTVYWVGQIDSEDPPSIEEYTVSGILWDGEKWYTTDDYCTFNEIGTDEAILDEGEALARFRKLRDEYIKNGGKI